MNRPDIYSDAERPERCANCLHVRTTVFRSVYGTERAYTVGRMESSEAVARETARIIADGIAKELGMTPGEEQTCDSR